jgi:hypothetical protein
MRTITLSAEDALIEAAEKRARAENTTLDEAFQKWLAEYGERAERVRATMKSLDEARNYASSEERAEAARAEIHELQKHVRGDGRTFTRDEMNER